MVENGTAPATTLMAMGRLIERLEAGKAEERQRFAERFGQFSTKKNHARFKRLFKATREKTRVAPETGAAKVAPEPEAPEVEAPEPEAPEAPSDPVTEPTIQRQDQR